MRSQRSGCTTCKAVVGALAQSQGYCRKWHLFVVGVRYPMRIPCRIYRVMVKGLVMKNEGLLGNEIDPIFSWVASGLEFLRI